MVKCLTEIRKLESTKTVVNHIYVLKIIRLTMTSMSFMPKPFSSFVNNGADQPAWVCSVIIMFLIPEKNNKLNLGIDERNLSSGIANNKGTDQPAHPRSLISAFVIYLLESIISKLATNSTFLASLCSRGDLFESRFVGNPEDRLEVTCWERAGLLALVCDV